MPVVPFPIPFEHLEETKGIWLPCLEAIAKRSRRRLDLIIEGVMSGETLLILAWDTENKKARALLGVRRVLLAHGSIAELTWMTGERRHDWTGLLPEIEQYMRDHHDCVGMTAVCRPGWSRLLKSNGYRTTHLVMEKDFVR